MIIYLGDGVDNLAGRTSHLPFEATYIAQFVLGFILLLGLKMVLLDSCEVEVARHAIRRAPWSTVLFNTAMPIQALGLALISSGLALLLGCGAPEPTGGEAYARWGTELICDGVAVVLLAFIGIEFAHKPPEPPTSHSHGPHSSSSAHSVVGKYHHEHLLVAVYWAQIGLEIIALIVCVVLPRLNDGEGFAAGPAALLGVLSALVYVIGVVNLLDEAAEGRIEALEALEAKQAGASEAENEAERDEFDVALAKLKELAERKATLRIEAIEALNALPGGGGGDSATAPLLTNAAVNPR